MRDFLKRFFDDAAEWCPGRGWLLRGILLLVFAVILLKHLTNPTYQSIFKGLNLGIHELGHVLFSLLGPFLGILGGTLLQLLAPVISVFMFYRQEDYFAIAVSFGWLSTSLFDVATYMADARSMVLPLVSVFGGGNVIHDWNYLFGKLGVLKLDAEIALLVRAIALLSMLFCLGFGGWLLKKMHGHPKAEPD